MSEGREIHEFDAERAAELLAAILRVEAQQNRMNEQQKSIHEVLRIMSTTIVTRDQFDAALKTFAADQAAANAAVTQALNDLAAKVAGGTVTTPEDFSAELATITTLQASAAAVTLTAGNDDPPAAAAGSGSTTTA